MCLHDYVFSQIVFISSYVCAMSYEILCLKYDTKFPIN
jgi:hypothetical protein